MSSTVSYKNILEAKNNLAPSQLKVLAFNNKNYRHVKELLLRELKKKDNGLEVGSANYIRRSPNYFIRAKGLSEDSFLPNLSGESVKPIRPQVFVNYHLREGDILISKDSNIGETIILDKDYPNYMPSGAIYKLPVEKNKFYLLAFLKSPIFKNQLDLMVPKGATIRHAKTLFLDCKIPFPNQKNSSEVIEYVEVLMQSIIEKEKAIRAKNEQIFNLIDKELKEHQGKQRFNYIPPTLSDLKARKRLDTGMYGEDYQLMNFLINNYANGSSSFDELGYKISRGQNLQVTAIGRSYYSDTYRPNFYQLILSKNFTDWMTVEKCTYLGNPKKLKTVKEGDVIFSCRGDLGRIVIFCEKTENTITNIDNVHISNHKSNLENKIFVGAFLNYLRRVGYLSLISITGSGADSFTKYQFDLIRFPNFSATIQSKIANLFLNPTAYPKISLRDFEGEHKKWNSIAGLYDLDKSIKKIKEHLNEVLERIVENEPVEIDFTFLKD